MELNIFWGIVFAVLFAFMFYWDHRKKKKQRYQPLREKNEHKKEVEKQIAIEKERSRRAIHGPGSGNGC